MTTTVRETIELCAAIMASLGGGGAIVFGLSNFLGKVWAERGLEKQKQEFTRLNLEFSHQLDLASRRVQMEIDALGVLHKRRAESEFEKVQELWKRMATLRDVISSMTPGVYKRFPNPELETLFWNERRKEFEQRYGEVRQLLNQETLSIPKHIADVADRAATIAGGHMLLFLIGYPGAPKTNPAPGVGTDDDVAGKDVFFEDYVKTLKQFEESLVDLEAVMREYVAGKNESKPNTNSRLENG